MPIMMTAKGSDYILKMIAYIREHERVTIIELAQAMGLIHANTRRYLRTMERVKVVELDGKDNKNVLTFKLSSDTSIVDQYEKSLSDRIATPEQLARLEKHRARLATTGGGRKKSNRVDGIAGQFFTELGLRRTVIHRDPMDALLFGDGLAPSMVLGKESQS